MTHDEADVVVVGLGPVGITLCNLLAAAGVQVEGIDAADDVYALPRAIGMDHEVMRIFQNIGAADAVAAATGHYRPSEYRSADGTLLRRFEVPCRALPACLAALSDFPAAGARTGPARQWREVPQPGAAHGNRIRRP